MSWLIALLILGWMLVRLTRRIVRTLRSLWLRKLRYRLEPQKNWALALAHPMAEARIEGGFAYRANPKVAPKLAQVLRPQLLHLLGLPTTLSEAAIRSSLPSRLDEHWFRIGLDTLHPDDDPHAAMAFACARIAFTVRVATMMGWISAEQQWRILHQNADRAGQCFSSWHDYGTAWARGRRQWIAHARADSLGASFSEADVEKWVSNVRHPWRTTAWPGIQSHCTA